MEVQKKYSIFAPKKENIMISTTKYMQMQSVPTGAILNSIIRQQQRTKSSVAKEACISVSHLYALINGKRRFTSNMSTRISKVLGIDTSSFFVEHQALHDNYTSSTKAGPHPDFKILSKTTFWDVRIEKINWTDGKSWAIRRVLEYGNLAELTELDRFYGREAIANECKDFHSYRLPNKVRNNWTSLIQTDYETAL